MLNYEALPLVPLDQTTWTTLYIHLILSLYYFVHQDTIREWNVILKILLVILMSQIIYVYLSLNLQLVRTHCGIIEDNPQYPELPNLMGDSNSSHDSQEPDDVRIFKFKFALV